MKLSNESPPFVDYEGRTPDSDSNCGARVIITLDTEARTAYVRTIFDTLDGDILMDYENTIDYLVACDITNHQQPKPPTPK